MLAMSGRETGTESDLSVAVATPAMIRAGVLCLWQHPDADFELPRPSRLARLAGSVWAAVYAARLESEPSSLSLEELDDELAR